jgi:hypothetical protein
MVPPFWFVGERFPTAQIAWWRLRPQFRNEPQNLLKHLPWDGDLGSAIKWTRLEVPF